jgi:glycosyltransferase involved in cell wall biosynthesis
MNLRRRFAAATLICMYEVTRALASLRRARPPRSVERILLIGTFHNTNWFYSHVTPLTRTAHVYLVCDEPVGPLPNLTYLCPPRWLSTLVTRAGAKCIIACRAALAVRPDLCMGYHIMPAAIIARVAALIAGCPSAYQATGGWIEVEGGGWSVETPLLSSLGAPSSAVEQSATRLVSTFDLVVVRGAKARAYFAGSTRARRVEVITGSIEVGEPQRQVRDVDIVYVGRLNPVKRLHLLLDTVASLHRRGRLATAILVGSGPEEGRLKRIAETLGIAGHVQFIGRIDDVSQYLRRSKVFMLTSRSEGLSIAMLEAMSSGCVPVVANVGDLADAVKDGVTGLLVDSDDAEDFADRCQAILDDEARRGRMADSAYDWASSRYTVDAVARTWAHAFTQLTARSTELVLPRTNEG